MLSKGKFWGSNLKMKACLLNSLLLNLRHTSSSLTCLGKLGQFSMFKTCYLLNLIVWCNDMQSFLTQCRNWVFGGQERGRRFSHGIPLLPCPLWINSLRPDTYQDSSQTLQKEGARVPGKFTSPVQPRPGPISVAPLSSLTLPLSWLRSSQAA